MAGSNFRHGAISGHRHGGQSLGSEPPSYAVVTGFFKSRTAKHTLQVDRDSTSSRWARASSKETPDSSVRDTYRSARFVIQVALIVLLVVPSLLVSLYLGFSSLKQLAAAFKRWHYGDPGCENGYLGGLKKDLHLGARFSSTDDLRGCILTIDSRFADPGPSALLREVTKQLQYMDLSPAHQQSSKQRERLEALVMEASYYNAAQTINWYSCDLSMNQMIACAWSDRVMDLWCSMAWVVSTGIQPCLLSASN